MKEQIKLWKELGVEKAEIPFNCGGDSMGEIEVILYDNKGDIIENEELSDYLQNEVYSEVEFYEVSDGHYMGESGTVYVELDEDEDDENGGRFNYTKDAMAEYSEHCSETMYVGLDEKEIELLKTKILSIMGGEDGDAVNYKDDCILTDEEEEILEGLTSRIDDEAINYEFDIARDAETSDWYRFTTNIDDEDAPLTINDENQLLVQVETNYYTFVPSED